MNEHYYNGDDYGEVEPIKRITITRNEALYIDDCSTMLIEPEANLPLPYRPLVLQASISIPANLMDKVGQAILDTTDKHETEIDLFLSELYMLREICISYVKYGTEPVGYNLKKKIYKAILEKDVSKEDMLADEHIENLLANVDMFPKLTE